MTIFYNPLHILNTPRIIEYLELREKYASLLSTTTKKHNRISTYRLLTIVLLAICIFLYFKTDHTVFLFVSLFSIFFFLLLMKEHQKTLHKKLILSTLVGINTDEINYLNHQELPFADGARFMETDHPYAHDLDIFEKKSIYQHINRTATYIGGSKLGALFLAMLPPSQIHENQEAIKELSPKTVWRQNLLATAKIKQDSETVYHKLIAWSKSKHSDLSHLSLAIAFVSPVALAITAILCYVTQSDSLFQLIVVLFLFNLSFLFIHLKKIKQELINFDSVHQVILQYSLLLQGIEDESFQSEKMIRLKAVLKHKNEYASKRIKQLSSIFGRLDSIHNGAGALLFNGLFLYHMHTLNALLKWKNKYAAYIESWLDVVGDIEALNSLANFSHNNPKYVFPTINNEQELVFEDVGHPLIKEEKRVCNSIAFKNQKFYILTGSNMSGKSTFLRCVGINMVLAGIGAPICSSKATIHPLPVYASMRLSDSLTDSESYFFAELKRLKLIMNQLAQGPCFILLDEILRGTNSDDKRSGTIAVIRKMVKNKAIGIIATHDLEVCDTVSEAPEYVSNKCFEVEIIDNDLHFDYKLRDAVCKNKSASFLMDKMGIV